MNGDDSDDRVNVREAVFDPGKINFQVLRDRGQRRHAQMSDVPVLIGEALDQCRLGRFAHVFQTSCGHKGEFLVFEKPRQFPNGGSGVRPERLEAGDSLQLRFCRTTAEKSESAFLALGSQPHADGIVLCLDQLDQVGQSSLRPDGSNGCLSFAKPLSFHQGCLGTPLKPTGQRSPVVARLTRPQNQTCACQDHTRNHEHLGASYGGFALHEFTTRAGLLFLAELAPLAVS